MTLPPPPTPRALYTVGGRRRGLDGCVPVPLRLFVDDGRARLVGHFEQGTAFTQLPLAPATWEVGCRLPELNLTASAPRRCWPLDAYACRSSASTSPVSTNSLLYTCLSTNASRTSVSRHCRRLHLYTCQRTLPPHTGRRGVTRTRAARAATRTHLSHAPLSTAYAQRGAAP